MLILLQCCVALSLFCATAAQEEEEADYDYVSECPEPNGLFADAVQCDKYYECKNGTVSEHLCPDGKVYAESSSDFAVCNFPFSIPCNGRTEFQTPKARPGCPRANGYFADPDSSECAKFNFCQNGVPIGQTCAPGLVFSEEAGGCRWPDQAKRTGCGSKEKGGFVCPDQLPGRSRSQTRHPNPDDCELFYICIGGEPRPGRCDEGLVFDPKSLYCRPQDEVEGKCATWFDETSSDRPVKDDRDRNTPAPIVNKIQDALDAARPRPQPQVTFHHYW